MKKKVTVRPGKTGSLAGGIVGIFFVLIGLTVAIPQAGLFGILWTGVAVFIAGSNLYNAFSEKGIVSHTIEIDEDGKINYSEGADISFDGPASGWTEAVGAEQPEYRVDPGSTVEERLVRLKDLYDKQLITQAEYEEKRKEILKDL